MRQLVSASRETTIQATQNELTMRLRYRRKLEEKSHGEMGNQRGR
jgi:hypothetical protein